MLQGSTGRGRGYGRGSFRGRRGGHGDGLGGGDDIVNSNFNSYNNNGDSNTHWGNSGGNDGDDNNYNNGYRGGRGRGRGGRSGRGSSRGGSENSGGGSHIHGLGPHRTNLKHDHHSNRGGSFVSKLHRGGFNGYQGDHTFGQDGQSANANGTRMNFNSSRGGKRQHQPRNIIVFVTVQNKDSQGQTNAQNILNDPGLGDFLCRKAHPTTITPSNPRYNEMKNSMSFLVGDLEQAQALRSLSGIYYNAQKLLITTSADQGQIQDRTHYNKATIEAVRTFIQSRHNDGFLNLERMAADPILHQGHFIPPGQNSGRHDSGSLLFKTAAELFPKVTTISLAHNNLTSLQSISTLGQYYPNLLHLSLKGNNISTLDELQNLCRNGRLQHLTELILVDNPVREMEIQAHGNDCINYKSNVTRLIPSLERLDGTEVPKISFGLDIGLKELSKVSLPAPVRGNFFDSAETQSTVLEFLTSFFRMFDTDRASLGHIYHPHGTFSYTAIPESSLRQTQRQGHSFGYQSNTPLRQSVWTEYTSRSRNLLTISDPSIREKTLFVGNQMIVQQSLLRLPMTAHDLSDDSKICVDAWQTGSLFPEGAYIFASVHGEFEEQRRGVLGSSTRKSFDRTFVLAPAPADSFAAQNGWRCVIISDQLTIREHKGHESWNPEIPLNVAASLAEAVDGVANAKLLHLSGGISEEQNAKAQELMRLSGLVYQYAVQALVTSGWDLGQALAAVQAARGTLPPNAWQIS